MIADLHSAIHHIEETWPMLHVLVVGDLMLDRYVWGDVERISPEAPVPILRAAHTDNRPGGAANVAMNIAGAGAKVSLAGFVGEDDDGRTLEHLLGKSAVCAHLTKVPRLTTTSKIRVLSGSHQMLRLDFEDRDVKPDKAYSELLERSLAILPTVDMVVLSDYAKGALTAQVCQTIIAAAQRRSLPILVDPKSQDFLKYRGATALCPNRHELSLATGETTMERLFCAGQKLVPELGLEYLVVTLGEQGLAALRENSYIHVPAAAKQVYDVSGAGDTVIALLALSLSCKLEMVTALQLANIAAGVVVSKIGTVPIQRHELNAALSDEICLQPEEKVVSLGRALSRTAEWRAAGQRIVLTNGCFDLLHVGHLTLLEEARKQGDRLIVAINSDRSVQQLKGPARPIVKESERARIMAALRVVDAVLIFDDLTPIDVITSIRPDVLVKGGDYTEKMIVGAREVRSWGGCVKIVPTVEGFSTTTLASRTASQFAAD